MPAFLRLEFHCYQTKVGGHEAKVGIIREAIRSYLANPAVLHCGGAEAVGARLEPASKETSAV